MDSLFNKVADLKLYQKETPTQMFFVKFTNFLRTPFFTEHAQWLLLVLISPSCTILYKIKFSRYILNKITVFRELNILRFLQTAVLRNCQLWSFCGVSRASFKIPSILFEAAPSPAVASPPRIIVLITS